MGKSDDFCMKAGLKLWEIEVTEYLYNVILTAKKKNIFQNNPLRVDKDDFEIRALNAKP